MKSFAYALCFLLFLGSFLEASNPEIVAFLGAKRVGKDTAADHLVETQGYTKYSLASPMKQAVKELFHFSDEQMWGMEKDVIDPYWGLTPREVMQFIGIDTLFNGLGERFPHLGHTFFMRAFERWSQEHPGECIVIADLRMQEELCCLKEMGALVIKLERPGFENSDSHFSEAQVASVEGYDLSIVNDGSLEEFLDKIDKALTDAMET